MSNSSNKTEYFLFHNAKDRQEEARKRRKGLATRALSSPAKKKDTKRWRGWRERMRGRRVGKDAPKTRSNGPDLCLDLKVWGFCSVWIYLHITRTLTIPRTKSKERKDLGETDEWTESMNGALGVTSGKANDDSHATGEPYGTRFYELIIVRHISNRVWRFLLCSADQIPRCVSRARANVRIGRRVDSDSAV